MKPSLKPRPKIQAAGIAGGIALLAVVARDRLGVELSAEEASLIVGGVTWLGGYLKRDRTSN